MRSSHLWLWTLAVALLPAVGVAQQTQTMGGGTSGGMTSITVHVSYQQNHRPAAGMRAELLSSYGGVVDIRSTDGNGRATFNGVSDGRYRLRVSGPDIEATTGDLIEAGGSIGGPYITENMEVRLTKLPGEGAGATGITVIVPEAAQKEFKLGLKEMDKKHYEQARDHFQKAIAVFPKYAEAFNSLALAEIQLNDAKDAVEAFRSATHIDPTLPRANLYLGQFYYDNHQYKEAEPYFLHCVANQPQNAQVLTALVYVQLQNGETDLALGNARKVSSLPDHKQFAISHLYAAQALTGKGQDDEIAKEYNEYLKEAPDSLLAPRVKDALAKLSPSK